MDLELIKAFQEIAIDFLEIELIGKVNKPTLDEAMKNTRIRLEKTYENYGK